MRGALYWLCWWYRYGDSGKLGTWWWWRKAAAWDVGDAWRRKYHPSDAQQQRQHHHNAAPRCLCGVNALQTMAGTHTSAISPVVPAARRISRALAFTCTLCLRISCLRRPRCYHASTPRPLCRCLLFSATITASCLRCQRGCFLPLFGLTLPRAFYIPPLPILPVLLPAQHAATAYGLPSAASSGDDRRRDGVTFCQRRFATLGLPCFTVDADGTATRAHMLRLLPLTFALPYVPHHACLPALPARLPPALCCRLPAFPLA